MPTTTYTLELAEEICAAIQHSSKGIKKHCEANTHWPSEQTIFNWIKKHPEFKEMYKDAKRRQAHTLVDEMIDIADHIERDTILNRQGEEVINREWVDRSKLRIDTRKWVASRLNRKVYGDNPEPEKDPLADIPPEEQRRLITQLLDTARAREALQASDDAGKASEQLDTVPGAADSSS